jgi:hypothetical protein
MSIRIQSLDIDCADPIALGRWWAEALGWRVTQETLDETVVEPPADSPDDGVVPDLVFGKVPETKSTKNRLHLDLRPADQSAEVQRLMAMGASEADVGQGDDVSWVVLADPEGNEFCVLRAFTAEEVASL